MNWKITDKRYVAFFDIMGFKELVERNSHNFIVEKLRDLRKTISILENLHAFKTFLKDVEVIESKSISFSDSIMIFSKDDTLESLNKIIIDSSVFLYLAIEIGIPIKGALSYGEITLDFENTLFFGRPIIDAYLLHDELYLYSAIMDNRIEEKMEEFVIHDDVAELISTIKVPLKKGRVEHRVITPPSPNLEKHLKDIQKLYSNVSGSPRLYIDNTLDIITNIIKRLPTTREKDE